MKLKGTFGLFLFVLLLGGVTYYFEVVQVEQKENTKKETSKIVTFSKDQIDSLRILADKPEVKSAPGTSSGPTTIQVSDIIELKRGPEGWSLISPLKDNADNSEVESYLGEISSELYVDVAKEGQDIDWKAFGLDKPKGSIEMKTTAGAKVTIAISGLSNYENQTYLRRDQESKALLAPLKWQSFVAKTAFNFRDKRLLRGRTVSVDSFELTFGSSELGFIQKDAKWVPEDKLLSKSEFKNRLQSFHTDVDLLKKFLEAIDDARATEYAFEGGLLDSASKKKFGLDEKPLATLVLSLKDKKWEADFYKTKDNSTFAYIKDLKFLLKLDSFAADKILKTSWNQFRNHKDLFHLKDEATRVQFESPAKKWKAELKNNSWQLVDGDTSSEVNQEKMKILLNRFKELQVSEFAGLKVKGTDEPKLQSKLSFSNAKGELMLSMNWGGVFKKKDSNPAAGGANQASGDSSNNSGSEKSFYVVKTSLLDEAVTVESSMIDSLSTQDIFVQKAKLKSDLKAEVKPGILGSQHQGLIPSQGLSLEKKK